MIHLLAAHCVKGFMWFMIKVTFGEHDRCDDSMRPETRFVLRAISQKFSYSNFDNDMALLRLNDRVPITDYIRPICLPSNQGNYTISVLALSRQQSTMQASHCWIYCARNWESYRSHPELMVSLNLLTVLYKQYLYF